MPISHEDSILLNEREAAKVLSVSPRALFDMRKRGDVPFVVVGRSGIRYRRESLNDWSRSAEKTARDKTPQNLAATAS